MHCGVHSCANRPTTMQTMVRAGARAARAAHDPVAPERADEIDQLLADTDRLLAELEQPTNTPTAR